MNTSDKILLSKADAILLLAKASEKRCQGGTYLLRVISNIVAVGADASSAKIKRINRRVSAEAADLRKYSDFETYKKGTINEHQEPLASVWKWIIENRDSLKSQDVVDRIKKFPMTTITRDEDRRLNALGLRSSGDPEERFQRARIDVILLPEDEV